MVVHRQSDTLGKRHSSAVETASHGILVAKEWCERRTRLGGRAARSPTNLAGYNPKRDTP